MGSWGNGNFDNDGALDYVNNLIEMLDQAIEDCFAIEQKANIDEDGEAVILPSVAIVSLLCENCKGRPPAVKTVNGWKTKYLNIYDNDAEELDLASPYKEERRKVIENTFDKLESQSNKYWQI